MVRLDVSTKSEEGVSNKNVHELRRYINSEGIHTYRVHTLRRVVSRAIHRGR